MNRLAIVLVSLPVTVLLGTPPVLGIATERQVRARVAALEQDGTLSASVRSYDRGWFHSVAELDLSLGSQHVAELGAMGADSSAASVPSTAITVDFAHGPITLQQGLQFGLSSMIARTDSKDADVAALEQQLGVAQLFEFRGHTGFDGAIVFDADVPAIVFPLDEAAARFEFSGAAVTGRIKDRDLRAEGLIETVQVVRPLANLVIRNVRVTIDNEFLSTYVMPGEAAFSIEEMSVVAAMAGPQPVFEAKNFRLTTDSALHDDGALADMRVHYQLSEVRFDEDLVTGVEVGIGMRNLDVAALDAYAMAARDLSTNADIADPQVLAATYSPPLERLLAAGPVVTIDPLAFALDGEPFMGTIEVATNPAQLPPPGMFTLGNPLLLLGLVDANADLRLSKALAQRIATTALATQIEGSEALPPEQLEYMAEAQGSLMLTMLVSQSVLLEDGDDYRTTVRFADGELTLNGSPLPFGL